MPKLNRVHPYIRQISSEKEFKEETPECKRAELILIKSLAIHDSLTYIKEQCVINNIDYKKVLKMRKLYTKEKEHYTHIKKSNKKGFLYKIKNLFK